MGRNRAPSLVLVILTYLSLVLVPVGATFLPNHTLRSCGFDKIYQLGDSIADTGNLILETPIGAATCFARLPYGQNFLGNATGRCSNGLLIIDYIAMAAGLPLLNPYKNVDANFEHGVNFAVAGATALPVQILAEINILSPLTSSALTVQLDWISSHFNSICHNHTDCTEKLRNSLFMVGEMGGNDINYALLQGQTIDEIKSLVPAVVRAISDAVQSVIDKGAARIVVPGNFPIGCLPIYLTSFQTNNSAAYDELHCLKDLNHISMYQNELLKQAIRELKQENPNATIVYGDYYNSFTWLLRNAQHFGFDVASLLKSCCGTGGDYNFNLIRFCGGLEVPVCPDPSTRISWDGLHLTQDAYNMIARWIITDILPHFHCFR